MTQNCRMDFRMEKESVVRLRITTGGESITTQGGRYFRMVLSDASVRLFFFYGGLLF